MQRLATGIGRVGRRGRQGRVGSVDPRASLRTLGPALLLLVVLHIVAMVLLEGLRLEDAAWLTLSTITTVGYGDFSAQTLAGRIATAVFLFFGGIWLAFQIATVGFEIRLDRRQRMRCGRWRWGMENHILVLNTPTRNATPYVTRLACELRASHRFRSMPVQLVTTCFGAGLPETLVELGIVHYDGEPWDPKALGAANAEEAAIIIVLSEDESDPASDGRAFDIVDRLRHCGAKGRILCECVDDQNRPRLRRAGADILVRPMRGYPEMIVRALAAPGAESILEDLFTSRRDECWRYDVEVEGVAWRDLVGTLVDCDIGVPIAFRRRADGQMAINPPPDTRVSADKLYVIVREGNARPDQEIAGLLGGLVRGPDGARNGVVPRP